MKLKNAGGKRNRTIRWDVDADRLAERLAAERGYLKGGVSQLLEELVREEAENPRLEIEEPTVGYAKYLEDLKRTKKGD